MNSNDTNLNSETVQTAKKFSLNIEHIARDKEISHMDAVLDYCFVNNIEPDTVGRLITKSLKEKIEAALIGKYFNGKGYGILVTEFRLNLNIAVAGGSYMHHNLGCAFGVGEGFALGKARGAERATQNGPGDDLATGW